MAAPEAEARGIFLLVMTGLPAGSLVAGATQIGLDTWLLDASARLNDLDGAVEDYAKASLTR